MQVLTTYVLYDLIIGLKLIGFIPQAVVDGSSKQIMGLIFLLIQKYKVFN